ncbi:MAG TPA: stage III sporulation protein AE, partial [Candidatus Dormibacteraeota bacterium]|nr:stage III sporulation protein AE [Candidatus Dormibacteraeota bacterium]
MNPIKYLIAILFIFLLFPLDMYPVAAESTEQHVEDIMDENISLNEIESFWDELINEYGGFIPELKKTTLREFLKNNDQFSLKSTINGLLKYLGYELILNGKLLGSLLLLTLFSVILQT